MTSGVKATLSPNKQQTIKRAKELNLMNKNDKIRANHHKTLEFFKINLKCNILHWVHSQSQMLL